MIPRDSLFLQHMLDAIGRIERFTTDGRRAFLSDEKTQSAVMRQLEIIGEASKQISGETRRMDGEIPWRAMAATRDRLIHGYFSIRLDIVWNAVEHELPALRKRIERLISAPG